MASSKLGKTKCLSPRFYGFLDDLRGEFDLLTEECIRMKKEKDKLEATVKSQIDELHSTGTDPVMPASAFAAWAQVPFPQIFLVPQSQSFESLASRGSIVSQQTTVPLRLDIPSQCVSNPTTLPPLSTFASPLPSPSPTPSPSGPEEGDSSITFNHEVEKELDVTMANIFFHEQATECVKFSRDGKYLAAGCLDGKAYIYDVARGTPTCFLRNPLTLAEDEGIRAVCFSPDGRYLAAGALNGYIYIWEINSRYLRKAFKVGKGLACTLDFSQSGRLLVSASVDNTVRLWSMRYGPVRVLTDTHTRLVNDGSSYSSALFSPDERYVAASHGDGMVRIWNARTGQLMRRVEAHTGWANDIAFMPDGKGLMSAGEDKTLKYLDISSLHVSGVEETLPEREFSGHRDQVFAVGISPDGRWVASGSCDRRVCIWDIRDAVVQCSLNDIEEVWATEFSPAGGYLASSGFDGVVRLWKYSYIRNIPPVRS